MTAPRWKFWGWGYEGSGLTPDETCRLLQFYANRFDLDDTAPKPAPTVDDVALPPPRLEPPPAVARLCSTEPYERLVHTYGKSFPDAVRAFAREFERAPDVIARPQSEEDVVAVLAWAADAGAAVIPFGGGSSVVGGVEPAVGDGFAGTISLDLKGLDRVLEVDRTSRAARIQGGILGPALEAALKPHDLTLRHFPQSFECSTLGGWIATRSGGHFATLYTHIDDFVESLRVVTPAGIMESRRLPGSGAGPSPDRLMIGSEGALGVITEAWMRLQDRPRFRAGAAIAFDDFLAGAHAVRAVGQAGLFPANLRLVDAAECAANGVNDGSFTLLVLAFEFGRSSGRLMAGQSPAPHPGSRRPAAAGRERRGSLAHRVHPHALSARAAGPAQSDRRHLRDRDHLGSPGRVPRAGQERGRGSHRRGDRQAGPGRPAASPTSIRTARRPISPSMSPGARARCSSSGGTSRSGRRMR